MSTVTKHSLSVWEPSKCPTWTFHSGPLLENNWLEKYRPRAFIEGVTIDRVFSSAGNRPSQHCTGSFCLASWKPHSQPTSLSGDQHTGWPAFASSLELVSCGPGLHGSSASIWLIAICRYWPLPPVPSTSRIPSKSQQGSTYSGRPCAAKSFRKQTKTICSETVSNLRLVWAP